MLKNVSRANAENLTNLIAETLKEYRRLTDENFYKIVCFGADGAAVNMGSQSGIGVRLKQSQPLITSVHCMAHRLESTFKEIIKNHDTKVKIITLLDSIHKFYYNSSLNRSMLKQCSQVMV